MKANIVNYFNKEDWSSFIDYILSVAETVLGLSTNYDIGIVLANDAYLHELNMQYRGKDKPTDVLTFPDRTDNYLGDVIISMERCTVQSEEYGHSFQRELGFLIVHGLLHALGYDHHTPEDEQIMISLQEKILATANVKREAK
jgi:probable rRNA maturation factor